MCATKLQQLRKILRDMGSALCCYSGGVDSAFLLKVAVDELGANVVALTAVSPSLAERELQHAKQLAQQLGAEHQLVGSREVDNADYAKNPSNRCYFCKNELMRIARDIQRERQIPHILIGTNLDDLGGHRPGMQAAQENAARHPLVEAELTKDEIRQLSRSLGLPTWNKPQMACLASRFPYGTAITPERLARVEQFEAGLADLGFRGTRVRFHDTVARLELDPAELSKAVTPEVRGAIVALGRRCGFTYTAVDLQGYRTGSLNELAPER